MARSAGINPASILVSFQDPKTFVEFQAWFSHTWGDPSHQWMVETADTQADLDAQTGSYALVVPWTGTPSDQFSVVALAELVTALFVRLTVERLTGDN